MRVLDLFCGAGGAAMGYAQHGAEIIGVDIKPQPSFPFTFLHIDALRFLTHLNNGGGWTDKHGRTWRLTDFDLIHASPPCQLYTAGNRAHLNNPHPDLIQPTRELLEQSGLPYVIENVPGAPLNNPIELCGRMFGLGATDNDGEWLTLDRHRNFETNFPLQPPTSCRPHDRTLQVAGVYDGARRDKHEARHVRGGGYVPASLDVLRELLGIHWMNEKELYLAIPPRYTEWLAGEFMKMG